MPTEGHINIEAELPNYGINCQGSGVHFFGETATVEHIDYLDLAGMGGSGGTGKAVRPDGVAENQGRPLLFFVNESRLAESPDKRDEDLSKLRRNLACRGDRAYLARIRPGELLVVPVTRYSIVPKLTSALRARTRKMSTTVFPRQCKQSTASSSSEPTHITEHQRAFRYEQNGRQAPPISLRHLWLKRD